MRWKELYAEELSEHPKLAELLADPERILNLAKLSVEEKEVWKLRAGMTEAEIAEAMHRQVKTIRELLRRAEYKLKEWGKGAG